MNSEILNVIIVSFACIFGLVIGLALGERLRDAYAPLVKQEGWSIILHPRKARALMEKEAERKALANQDAAIAYASFLLTYDEDNIVSTDKNKVQA